MDAMLDLETLSTRPWSVILTLGAIKFSPWEEDVEWATQTEEVREEALGTDGRISINDMLNQLNRFLVGVDNIWCQGPAFDIVILEDLYRQVGRPTPWQFWQIRDSRTLFGVHGDPREKNRHGAHNALIDCYYQACAVQHIYKTVGVKKR